MKQNPQQNIQNKIPLPYSILIKKKFHLNSVERWLHFNKILTRNVWNIASNVSIEL